MRLEITLPQQFNDDIDVLINDLKERFSNANLPLIDDAVNPFVIQPANNEHNHDITVQHQVNEVGAFVISMEQENVVQEMWTNVETIISNWIFDSVR